MKTVHIKQKQKNKNKKLIRELYKDILIKDKEFHFFYEPELIIRTNFPEEVAKFLDKQNLNYRIYGYPKAIGEKGNYCYECNDFTIKYIDIFSQIYHLQSLAALTLSKEEYKTFIDQITHTAFNAGGYSYYEEGERQLLSAFWRLNQTSMFGILDLYKKVDRIHTNNK